MELGGWHPVRLRTQQRAFTGACRTVSGAQVPGFSGQLLHE
jgi:hypothetical protein